MLPSLREYGSFEENGKTVVICDLHYDFYYDYTGPDWEWNGGAMSTYLRAELETQDGAEVCTGFEIFPGGSPSDWISGECGPLAMQNVDGAWGLPEASGDWFPADMNLLQQYLEVIASLPRQAASLRRLFFRMIRFGRASTKSWTMHTGRRT